MRSASALRDAERSQRSLRQNKQQCFATLSYIQLHKLPATGFGSPRIQFINRTMSSTSGTSSGRSTPPWDREDSIDAQREKYGKDNYWQMRCICGATEGSLDFEEDAVCDGCKTKRHKLCMGLGHDEAEFVLETDTSGWYCEKCQPDEHRGTLNGLAHGDQVREHWKKLRRDGDLRTGITGLVTPEHCYNTAWTKYFSSYAGASHKTSLGVLETGLRVLLNVLNHAELEELHMAVVEAYCNSAYRAMVKVVLKAVEQVCNSGSIGPMLEEALRRYFML